MTRTHGDRNASAPIAESQDDARPLSSALTWSFAVACGASVANVYYAQPLLDVMAQDFHVSLGTIGMVVTATQVGCALALLLLVPLGDMVDRRKLMSVQMLLLALSLAAASQATARPILLLSMAAVGMLATAMTQGLIAFAATVAPPLQREYVVGMAQGGVVIGLLMARTVAGIVADFAGWRAVYAGSAAFALLMVVALWRLLPPAPRLPRVMSYPRLVGSMFTLLATERTLQIRGTLAMLLFAAFSVFWSAISLLLTAPPYSLSLAAVGAFGLAGVAGALGAARAGGLADRGLGQWTSGVALLVLVLSWLPTAYAPQSLWALAIGAVLLDFAGQAIHVTNQGMILPPRSGAHSRMVGCYMLFYAVGSGTGALAATQVYATNGWTGVCMLGVAISAMALVWWALTRHLTSTSAPQACVTFAPQVRG